MEVIITNSMLCPQLEASHRLGSLMKKISQVDSFSGPEAELNGQLWSAEHFNLHNSKLFHSLPIQKQQQILTALSHRNISLAYYIEKFGLNYGAKMIAQATSVEEKSLYTFFSADEARHRLLVEKFLIEPAPENINFHPLLPALAYCLEHGSHLSMIFTVQVLLEGFGIYHYSYLKDSTRSAALKNAFNLILKDEAGHHGMGLILTENMNLTNEQSEQICELTSMFVQSLLVANWVTEITETICGGFTKNQLQQFQNEIAYNEQLIARKEKIKTLLKKSSSPSLIQLFEDKKII